MLKTQESLYLFLENFINYDKKQTNQKNKNNNNKQIKTEMTILVNVYLFFSFFWNIGYIFF